MGAFVEDSFVVFAENQKCRYQAKTCAVSSIDTNLLTRMSLLTDLLL